MLKVQENIIEIARREPGIGLAEAARRLNISLMVARYWAFNGAAEGKLRIEKTPGRVYLFPAAIADNTNQVAAN